MTDGNSGGSVSFWQEWNDGRYHCLTVVFDGKTVKYYIDGKVRNE